MLNNTCIKYNNILWYPTLADILRNVYLTMMIFPLKELEYSNTSDLSYSQHV